MPDLEWPQPPIRWEDLPDLLELLGREADNRCRGWVLVPASWTSGAAGGNDRPAFPATEC